MQKIDKKDLEKYIGREDMSVVDAMKKINDNARGILYIINESGRLIGSLSDGDIRRGIIRNPDLTQKISGMVFSSVRSIKKENYGIVDQYMDEKLIQSVPVIDDDGSVVDICFRHPRIGFFDCVPSKSLHKVPVVIMAGGKGARLYPYTRVIPKPLIPIDGIPILERIMKRFHQFGVDEFILSVNYKKGMIKSYFADADIDYKISFVEEDMPLGTVGSLCLIEKRISGPFFITNCDIYIQMDYNKAMDFHISNKNDVTIVSSIKSMEIPYGVIHPKENGVVEFLEEKPVHSFLVNTGMYILNPEYLSWIPKHQPYDMTDLISRMLEKGRKVGMFPVGEDSFLDMGEFDEMKRMEEKLTNGMVE